MWLFGGDPHHSGWRHGGSERQTWVFIVFVGSGLSFGFHLPLLLPIPRQTLQLLVPLSSALAPETEATALHRLSSQLPYLCEVKPHSLFIVVLPVL